MKRKIADCINIQINVGNYQHIAITKYAEEEIEYSNDQERKDKEDSLTTSLVDSIMRSMVSIPEKLKRGTVEAMEVEQAIRKTIPEWLANNPVPNIATNSNGAKKQNTKIVNEQKDLKDKLEISNKEIVSHLSTPSPIQEVVEIAKPSEVVKSQESDLFENDAEEISLGQQDSNALTGKTDKVDLKEATDFFSDSEELFDGK